MSTITTINSADLISDSRTDINTNFSNLNTDKIETSYLDTDNTLAANSDSKIATQKAVKAYVDSGGNVNASTTARGIVEEATSAEITAGTGVGATGARLFVNPTAVAETGADKILKIKSTGFIDSSVLPTSVTTPAFFQQLPTSFTTGTPADNTGTSGSNTTGSVLYLLENDNLMRRYARDSNSGMYLYTHEVAPVFSTDNTSSIVVIGNYIYHVLAGSSFIQVNRYDADTLLNGTTCSVPSVAAVGAVTAWTDGTAIYVIENATPTTCRKWTISGTTLTADSTTTCPTGYQTYGTTMYDGTNIYLMKEVTSTNYTIVKISGATFASVTSTTTYLTNAARASYWSSTIGGRFMINIDTTRMYVGCYEVIFNAAAQYTAHINLLPVTKP